MAISTTTRWTYTPDGVTTAFAYDNLITAATDLKVYFDLDGVITEQVSGFSVSGVGDEGGGNVTFSSAPALVDADKVVIESEIPSTQALDLTGALTSPTDANLNAALNRVTRILQDLERKIDRCIRQDDGQLDADIGRIPAVEIRASTILSFDSSGDPVITSARFKSYATAGVPSASTEGAGAAIHVTDGAAGSPCLAFSDGTDWLRCDTLTAISAS